MTPERKARLAAQNRKWHQENRARKLKRDRVRRAANKDRIKAQQRAWYVANREHTLAKGREWKAKNQARIKAAYRTWYLGERYGLTLEQYTTLHESQEGRCAICREECPLRAKHTHIDHCHRSGRVRGILCHHCNLALGNLREDITRARRLIAYLTKHAV
jgi:hypothetical protein